MNIFVRFKSFFIGVGLFFVILLVALFAIKPTIEEIFTTQERIREARERLLLLSEKETLLKSVNKGQLIGEFTKLSLAIPQTIDLPLILATLEKIAADTQVELGEFSISSLASAVNLLPLEQGEKLSSFQFKIAVTGTFDNIQRFNEALQSVSPLLRIDNLEFASDKATLFISFYFQPKVTRKPPVDEPLFAVEAKDRATISKVSSLAPPVLEEPQVATTSAPTRENPFR